ncbi:hypothetical protein [Bradyrhizobium phage BDU-MI-1]|nr:hypothetical protein [Bradyrhizobium phage BDU-MI-1]
MRIAFVSCVKTKADRPLPAQDLYISPWFRMAREYARQNADRWFILSASAGLVNPHRVTDPYDLTLNGLGVKLQKDWAEMVIDQLKLHGIWGQKAIVLAGKNYRQFLMPELIYRFGQVEVPMEGLMMGQQLSWLSRRVPLTPE